MSPTLPSPKPSAPTALPTRLPFWLAGALLVVLSAALFTPLTAQAGTITIVDGPAATLPVDGVYTDGYIQEYLAITGSLTLTTTAVVTGSDEIRMLDGAVIKWTTGNTLTLDAGSSIVVSGTIQQDGPLESPGGVRLLVTGAPTGAVIIGTGAQTTGVAVGSRHGLTRIQAGNLALTGGSSGAQPFAQVGFRAVDKDATYTVTGAISVTVSQNVTATGSITDYAYAQIGHGGFGVDGDLRGDLSLINQGSLHVTAGSGEDAYGMIGHGSDLRVNPGVQGEGNRAGDIEVRVGETAVFSGSQVGHLSESGVLSVTAGNTLLGVSRNDPFSTGSGQFLITGVQTTSFTSAPTTNGGELRFYLPRQASQQTPLNTTFNDDTFVVTNTIPITQLAGFAPFGAGSYLPDYSFYLGGQPDLAIVKGAEPAGPLHPGDVLTYTVSFSNTGNVTATNVVLNDLLPTLLTGTVATLLPDSGVVISQTAGAPNFGWNISDLGPGQGGQVLLATNLLTTGLSLGATFTNTAAINATGDITLTNNTATVSRTLIAGATLTVTKVVTGAAPSNAWQYTGTGDIGSFTLPAAGGSTVITGLLPTTYTITETVQTGFTAVAACTDGASGSNSVQVTLAPAVAVGCVFTNTAAGPLVRLGLPAIHVGP